MRVLFVAHLYPWPAVTGNELRVFHLLRGIALRHSVTLVALTPGGGPNRPGGEGDPLAGLCERVIAVSDATCAFRAPRPRGGALLRWRVRTLLSDPLPWEVRDWDCPELLDTLRTLRASGQFDAVWVERAYIAEMVKRAGFSRIIVDLDDLLSVAEARELRLMPRNRYTPLFYAAAAKMYMYEKLLPRRFESLVVCKESDRRFFGPNNARTAVVPNGIEALAAVDPRAARSGEVLFTGLLSYPPNFDAAVHFCRDILPTLRSLHRGVRFAIVGRNAPPALRKLHNGRDCVVTSSVPDIAPYYQSASLVVVPMRTGSGTRLKVLEALVRAKAVVTTSVGAEGLDLRPGVDLEIVDNPVDFARTCARLLRDPAACERLGASGRDRVLSLYHWDRAVEVADRLLRAITTRSPAAGS